jgi:uncharacterized phage protein (TIGR01671 family)
MREIKFRGKRVDNGEWVYGYPIIVSYKAWIKDINDKTTNPRCLAPDFADFRCVEVEKETVSQYTGLKDKNGKEIYEGDIVFAEARFDCANMVVVWDKGSFVLVPCEKYKKYVSGCGYKDIRWLTKTVIGNIYENPKLMEETNND